MVAPNILKFSALIHILYGFVCSYTEGDILNVFVLNGQFTYGL